MKQYLLLVTTRFGDVSQIHHVGHAGGSEFSQIFLLDPSGSDDALNEGHGYRKKENRDVYQQATMMFLREHLLN